MVDGRQYEVDCLIYGTGFEAERTPLARRVGHDIVGRNGVTLAERWADGPLTLFGILSRDFPNMFAMPAPSQQSVVTVNYTQLAVLGAEFVGSDHRPAPGGGGRGVRRQRRGRGVLGAGDRREVHRHQPRHVRLHAVADQQRGASRDAEPEGRQLRRRLRRLVRLPRDPRELARGRPLRGPRARLCRRRRRPRHELTPSGRRHHRGRGGDRRLHRRSPRPRRLVRRHPRPARHPRRHRAAAPTGGLHGGSHRRGRRVGPRLVRLGDRRQSGDAPSSKSSSTSTAAWMRW